MKAFSTSILIDATADTVWNILIDTPRWPDWNTTIDKVEGNIAAGEQVTVYSKISPGRAFPLEVTEFEPPRRMVWSGGMPLGLFTGKRTYTLTPRDDNSIEFSMQEAFTGLMAPLITRSIPDLQPSFNQFANCLKQHAERTDHG
ncbi:MAG: SRPBCC domain-containing protein [Cyanobacteria bacterium J06638_6]